MAEYDNQRMRDLRLMIDRLETQKKIPLPTPEVGRCVVWYRGLVDGKPDGNEIAAIVTRIDGPGQISLRTFEHNSSNSGNVTGSHYVEHPFLKESPAVAKRSGCWDYSDGDKPTQKHGQIHIAELDRKIRAAQEELRLEREREIRRSTQAPPPEKPKAAATVS